MDIRKTKELLQKYLKGNCSHSENKLVEKWYQQLIDTGELQWNKEEKDLMQKIIEARIMKQINDTHQKPVFYFRPRLQ